MNKNKSDKRKCCNNSRPSTDKIVQAIHALSNKFCYSHYCTATVRCKQNSGKQNKKKYGPRMPRMDKCPHAFLGCPNPKL